MMTQDNDDRALAPTDAAAVREAAARVAESFIANEPGRTHQQWADDACRTIAAAIRQLDLPPAASTGTSAAGEVEVREVLAQAYERANLTCPAADIRSGNKVDWVREKVALDAIAAALAHPPSPELREGVYVASRASISERGAMWRALRASGVKVNATWIDEDGEGQTADWSELWTRIEREVRQSAGLILYAEPNDFPLKGAFVEAGIAIGAGIRVVIVAPGVPRGNRPLGSWTAHPLVSFADDVASALEALTPARVERSGEELNEAGRPGA